MTTLRKRFEKENPDCLTWDQVDYWLNYANFLESLIKDKDEVIKAQGKYIDVLKQNLNPETQDYYSGDIDENEAVINYLKSKIYEI